MEGDFNVMVLDLLGPSVEELFIFLHKNYFNNTQTNINLEFQLNKNINQEKNNKILLPHLHPPEFEGLSSKFNPLLSSLSWSGSDFSILMTSLKFEIIENFKLFMLSSFKKDTSHSYISLNT